MEDEQRARAQRNGARGRNRIEAIMTEHFFDHDRLDVYRLSIEYLANVFDTSRSLEGLHRHARDQWLRAAQSIPLSILPRVMEKLPRVMENEA
jgi:hypothetical protein